MSRFGLFAKSCVRKPSSWNIRYHPRLEGLESRLVPYSVSGDLWPHPQLITLSFVPDGTNLGGVTSNLFSTFNARWSTQTWENQILKAAQVWAQQTNVNFSVISDSGAPSGSGNYEQGDPSMGDIRIGGYNFGSSSLAMGYLPPPINNFSLAGDIAFNTGMSYNIGSTYDLFTVAVHEFGHALGALHSGVITADMYASYGSTKYNLASDDIAAIRNIYSNNNPRSTDIFAAANNSFANAANIASWINTQNDTALVTGLDITNAGQKEYFKVTAPAGTSSTVTITAQSAGLSLLAPTLTVYAADQTTVLGSISGAGHYGTTLTLNLSTLSAGQVFYIKVGGADSTAFGTGAYALTMSFAGAASPIVPLPNTQTLNGDPLSGGGGIANATSLEMRVGTPNSAGVTTESGTQNVAMSAGGNYVVTYASYGRDGSGWGVFAQRFDAQGNALSPEFQVNTTTAGDQVNPSVATDAAGDFVVVWSSNQTGSWSVFGQRYDPSGNVVGSEFQISPSAPGDQKDAMVAIDDNSDFVVTWASYDSSGNSRGILAQRFDSTGAAIGGDFQVNTTPGTQANASVATNGSGNFVVTWSSYGQDGSGWGVYGQLYDATGTPVGGEFQVNTYTAGDQDYSSVAMSRSGAFVVTWSSNGEDGDGWGIFAQRYDETGAPVGGEFQVNTTTAGNQVHSKVAMTPDGDFTISWESDRGGQVGNKTVLASSNRTSVVSNGTSLDPTVPNLLGLVPNLLSGLTGAAVTGNDPAAIGWDIYAQQFNGDDGSMLGDEFRVNTTTAGDQRFSSLAINPEGHIVAVWTTTGNVIAKLNGIYSQLYAIGGDNLSAPDPSVATADAGSVPTTPAPSNLPARQLASAPTPGAASVAMMTPATLAPSIPAFMNEAIIPVPAPATPGEIRLVRSDSPIRTDDESSPGGGFRGEDQPEQSLPGTAGDIGSPTGAPFIPTAITSEAQCDACFLDSGWLNDGPTLGADAFVAEGVADPGAMALALTVVFGLFQAGEMKAEAERKQHLGRAVA
jgi:hypothetical protein